MAERTPDAALCRGGCGKVKRQITSRLPDALEAMGREAVRMVVAQMESGYGRPIRKTGALMADVDSQVNGDRVEIGPSGPISDSQRLRWPSVLPARPCAASGADKEVGNRLHYSLYVHEGTCKMAGRHYINDALRSTQALSSLGQIAKEKLFGE